MEPGGHIDCHLSAKVDTMGGRVGLFSKMRSISAIIFVFNFGTSCNFSILKKKTEIFKTL